MKLAEGQALSGLAEIGCTIASARVDYNLNRTYNPATGRYLEADPIGLNGGWNLYGYANQNPMKFIDPFGLESMCEKIGYKACSKIAKDCQYSCGVRGGGTLCTDPCQTLHNDCRLKVKAECEDKEPSSPKACGIDPEPDPDPLTPNCTYEKWVAGLCGK